MAIIIGIVSQKGGVGKSTIARLIAREFANSDWTVKIADMDTHQGTSFHWTKRRAANQITPDIRTEAFSSVKAALKDADNFDLFIFDGAPHATPVTRDIAQASDMIILPTGLAIDDLEPQVILAHELVKNGTAPAKIAFILWRVGESDAEIAEARDYITRAGYRILDGAVPDRTAYRRASDYGLAATETKFQTLNEKADAAAQSIVDAVTATVNRRKAHGTDHKTAQAIAQR
jgi:chromosome partitioning protein